jgi:glycosyltransferase involved in cell wall biosynthesis
MRHPATSPRGSLPAAAADPAAAPAPASRGTADDRTPARPHVAILDCDVADGVPRVEPLDERGQPWTRADVLVRAFTEMLGVVSLPVGPTGLDADELAQAIAADLGPAIADRVRGSGLAWHGALSIDGLHPRRTPPFLAGRARAWSAGPTITAAVCTRNRPQGLTRLLESLQAQRYPVDVVIVDNAPDDDATQRVARRFADRLDLTYAVEPRPGLSWARNRCIEVSRSQVIAWVDDDERCDPWWAAEIARAIVEHPDAEAVCGSVLPGEIETPAQARFEDYGGHSKGRGMTAAVFSPATRADQSPLYPLPPFGIGGNMAFRRDAIERIGRFDCALGAGTLTGGAEDTAALSTLLYLGGTVVYQPNAMVRHWHRREDDSLRDMFVGYGCGLGAFYTSMVLRHPGCVPELLRLAPRALRDLRSRDAITLSGVDRDTLAELLAANRAAMRTGPLRYLRARRVARRLRAGVAR